MSKIKSMYNKGDEMLLNNKQLQEGRLYNYYKALTLNRFKWNNLPYPLESRHIETALFETGQGFFTNIDIDTYTKYNGFLCLPCYETNDFNILGDPLGVTMVGFNYTENIKTDKGVRILDNDTRVSPKLHILYYVNLLSQIELTINMNLDQQKIPFIIPTTKKNKISLDVLMGKYYNFEPTIYVDEKLNEMISSNKEHSTILNTNVPYLLDKLSDFKKKCQNELLTFLGLNNANNDKKERMLTDEINSNNSLVLMSLDLAFKNRQYACEQINKKYGLNISVEKTINNLEVDFTGAMKDNNFDMEV